MSDKPSIILHEGPVTGHIVKHYRTPATKAHLHSRRLGTGLNINIRRAEQIAKLFRRLPAQEADAAILANKSMYLFCDVVLQMADDKKAETRVFYLGKGAQGFKELFCTINLSGLDEDNLIREDVAVLSRRQSHLQIFIICEDFPTKRKELKL